MFSSYQSVVCYRSADSSTSFNPIPDITTPVSCRTDVFGSYYLSYVKSILNGERTLKSFDFENVVGGKDNYINYSFTFGYSSDDSASTDIVFRVYCKSSIVPPSTVTPFKYSPYTRSGYTKVFGTFCTLFRNNTPFSNDSFNYGYDVGYEKGYGVGIEETLSDISPWEVLVDGLDSFFNMRLFGSISIGTIFKIVVSTLLIGFIIKIFLGG